MILLLIGVFLMLYIIAAIVTMNTPIGSAWNYYSFRVSTIAGSVCIMLLVAWMLYNILQDEYILTHLPF